MKVYWSRCKNFGDNITPYLYEKITGEKSIFSNDKKQKAIVCFGTGSIIHHACCWNNLIIWGSGIIEENTKVKFGKNVKILSVRGPITQRKLISLGYQCPESYGDIGLLLPRFYEPTIEKKYKVGIIPHYVDYELCKKMFSGQPNIKIIDVREPVEHVVNNILECEMTLSSSLHGIIVSHAYGLKCAYIKFSNKVIGGNTKFWDYYGSIDIIKPKPIWITDVKTEEQLVKMVDNYVQPKFPIQTDHIMKLCPFKK